MLLYVIPSLRHSCVVDVWTVERVCWRGCATLQLTSRWLCLQGNGSHDDGTSVNATFRESNHLEQLMPLNTVIITMQQTAHNTQRLDSVQVAEMADLWLDACDHACFERGCIGVTQTKLLS